MVLFAVRMPIPVKEVGRIEQQQILLVGNERIYRNILSQHAPGEAGLVPADEGTQFAIERQQRAHLRTQFGKRVRQCSRRIGQPAGFDEREHLGRDGKNLHECLRISSICHREETRGFNCLQSLSPL